MLEGAAESTEAKCCLDVLKAGDNQVTFIKGHWLCWDAGKIWIEASDINAVKARAISWKAVIVYWEN